MSRWREPGRLLPRARKGSTLGLALTAARAREPAALELQNLADSLRDVLGSDPATTRTAGAPSAAAPSAASAAAGRIGRPLVVKLGLFVVGLAVVSGGAWRSLGRAPEEAAGI